MHPTAIIIIVSSIIFALMLTLEITKDLIFGVGLPSWKIQWITVILTCLCTIIACSALYRKIDRAQCQRCEIRTRDEKKAALETVALALNHRLNTLTSHVQLIELENKTGQINTLTLDELRDSIKDTAIELKQFCSTTPENKGRLVAKKRQLAYFFKKFTQTKSI
ncbi:MAG: hypothetical protein OEW58_09490 [Gammaproteobacteria bacterium]|nr:hypothetical protein [Gammaproteobacteria bacterium]